MAREHDKNEDQVNCKWDQRHVPRGAADPCRVRPQPTPCPQTGAQLPELKLATCIDRCLLQGKATHSLRAGRMSRQPGSPVSWWYVSISFSPSGPSLEVQCSAGAAWKPHLLSIPEG